MKLIPMSIKEMSCYAAVPSEEALLIFIGECAGEAYNSSKDADACIKRALGCIKRGHHSVFEHMSITLKSTVDRGTSHALVRHRHCAITQSSTIYQKFQEIEIIEQPDVTEFELECYRHDEIVYQQLLNYGKAPSRARDVLPTELATNVIITTNLRQWMFMIQRRCGPGDSDNMHKWDALIRAWFEEHYPQLTLAFDTWYEKHPL